MDAREERGLAIATQSKINKTDKGYLVPSQTGKGLYLVNVGEKPACTCPDFEARRERCKHIYAVEFTIRREERPDGTVTETKTMKVTYAQDWPVYNNAQAHEQEHFLRLLRALCDGVPQPEQKPTGRPRLPIGDVIFDLCYRIYSTMSGRRFLTDLREIKSKGFVEKTPSFTSGFRYLEKPEMTALLTDLIELSATPLQSIESDFAVDSTGFATNTYSRWFDHKYGKERTRATFIKTHIMCGVKTHIVTSVKATPNQSSDTLQFPNLVAKTAEVFTINEVSADKAYSDRRNLRAVQAIGGQAYIPFMRHATGHSAKHAPDALWAYMLAYYRFNQSKFLEHYHKRSNAETTMFMIKSKFGSSVRAKTPTAQVNEVLLKVLAHNLCVLAQSIKELGIEAVFVVGCSKTTTPVPKLAWE